MQMVIEMCIHNPHCNVPLNHRNLLNKYFDVDNVEFYYPGPCFIVVTTARSGANNGIPSAFTSLRIFLE